MARPCAVFVGGDPVSKTVLDREKLESSLIITADVGYRRAIDLGITPDIVLGDFDSSEKPEGVNAEVYPVEKEDADLMLALKRAISEGCDDITIYGACGGRLDHTVGNIQAMAYCVSRGVRCCIIADDQRAEMFPAGEYRIEPMKNWSLSLFAYGGDVKRLTIKGAKYCCEDITLTPYFPLGVSNEVSEYPAHISFESGYLLCIRSKL